MALLIWNPEYSVGVPAVDDEHFQMITMINELHDRLGGRSDPEAVEMFLGDIHAAIAAHFALEERFMRKAEYEEYEDHKEDHELLLDQLRDLMDEYLDDPEAGNELLKRRLTDWFGKHFSSFDARLHDKLDVPEN